MYRHGGIHFEKPNMIDYTANINPLGMPESVRIAAERGIKDAIYYPDISCRELREGISNKEGIPQDMIQVGNGAAELIFLICQALNPKKALLIAPSFQEYEQALESVDCVCVYHDLRETNDFRLDMEAFLNQIEKEKGLNILFICNPNNPTGALIKKEELFKILDVCKTSHIFCVIDECFLDFAQGESMVPYLEDYRNLMVIKAFTKLYAMPGLRLGYGMTGDRGLMQRIQEKKQPWNVSVPAQYAGIAALQEVEFAEKSILYLKKEREYLLRKMEEGHFYKKIYPSQANYIFFLAERTLGDELYEKGYAIRDCSNYRNLGAGYYRIAVRQHEDNVRLLSAWQEIRDKRFRIRDSG